MTKVESGQADLADQVRTLAVSPSPLEASVWFSTLDEALEVQAIGHSSALNEAIRMSQAAEVILFCPGESIEAGIGWVRELHSVGRARPVVVGLPRDDDVFVAYIEAGAWACVFSDESVEAVVGAIVDVARGCSRVPSDMAPALIYRLFRLQQATIDPDSAGSTIEALTPRERVVLELVANGLTNQEIGRSLNIGTGTVKNHVHNILEKVQVENRHQASTYHSAARARPNGDG